MGKIFLEEDGHLVSLPERGYRDKDVGGKGEQTLQERLEQHPDLIPAEEINADQPPRFLVLKKVLAAVLQAYPDRIKQFLCRPDPADTRLVSKFKLLVPREVQIAPEITKGMKANRLISIP